MIIKSLVTNQPVYYISRQAEGWSWRLLWRYDESGSGFETKEEAIADAERHYNDLRERTATGCRRKIYSI